MVQLKEIAELITLLEEEEAKAKKHKEEVLDLLKDRLDKMTSEYYDSMEVSVLEAEGFLWTKEREGRESVEILKGAQIPEKYRTAPDKRLILKDSKVHPELIATFAIIKRGKGKLRYKKIT